MIQPYFRFLINIWRWKRARVAVAKSGQVLPSFNDSFNGSYPILSTTKAGIDVSPTHVIARVSFYLFWGCLWQLFLILSDPIFNSKFKGYGREMMIVFPLLILS